MKLIRYEDSAGLIAYAAHESGSTARPIHGDVFGSFEVGEERLEIGKLLAPVVPPMIVCIGANYRLHGEEVGGLRPTRPLVFLKGINSIQHPGQPIRFPEAAGSTKLDYEGELAVVIGKPCRNVSQHDALNYVLGYTCANDVSARDWQLEWGEGQWARGKSFDTFCPLGPCLVTPDELTDPQGLSIKTLLNGDIVQQSNTKHMLFSVSTLIAFVSQSTTLLPGTVILTGTPEGVGMARKPPLWLKSGDTVTVQISGIGELTNPVTSDAAEIGHRPVVASAGSS